MAHGEPGKPEDTFGTLGLVVVDARDPRRRFLLSASHVVTPRIGVVPTYGGVWQPLDPDSPGGGRIADKGWLVAHWHLRPEQIVGCRTTGPYRSGLLVESRILAGLVCDWAAVELLPGLDATPAAIAQIGAVADEPVAPRVGMKVLIRGAATAAVRQGTVREVDVSKAHGRARIEGVFLVEGDDGLPLTVGGDSGAVLVTADDLRPVGLLRGEDVATRTSMFHPMVDVLDDLALALG